MITLLLVFVCLFLCAACSRNVRKERETREQAIGFLNQGDYSAAVARFNEALSYSDGKTGRMEIDILRYRAEAEMLMEDYAAAADTYMQLQKEDEELPLYMNLAVICLVKSEGSLERAQALYRKSVEKDPDGPARREALYSLGSALSGTGNPDYVETAKELYKQEIAHNPTGELYNRMGMLEFDVGNYDTAIDWFDKGKSFMKSVPSDEDKDIRASLDYNTAICYEYQQEYAKALGLFRSYVEQYGSNETIDHEIAFLESRIR